MRRKNWTDKNFIIHCFIDWLLRKLHSNKNGSYIAIPRTYLPAELETHFFGWTLFHSQLWSLTKQFLVGGEIPSGDLS